MTACFAENVKQSTESISTVSPAKLNNGVQANSNKTCLPKLTYEDIFYRTLKPRVGGVRTSYGFPMQKGQWCTSQLKTIPLNYGVRQQVGAVLHRGTQTNSSQKSTDLQGTKIWGERNGVRGSKEMSSNESFLQARKRRAV